MGKAKTTPIKGDYTIELIYTFNTGTGKAQEIITAPLFKKTLFSQKRFISYVMNLVGEEDNSIRKISCCINIPEDKNDVDTPSWYDDCNGKLYFTDGILDDENSEAPASDYPYRKDWVHILVQDTYECAEDFAERISSEITAQKQKSNAILINVSYTSTSDGRQTCNMLFAVIDVEKIKKNTMIIDEKFDRKQYEIRRKIEHYTQQAIFLNEAITEFSKNLNDEVELTGLSRKAIYGLVFKGIKTP